MVCCLIKPRCFFLFLCYLQLITLIIRQTFDFFGHLWLCIIVNFITILLVIVGIFGGHQYRPCYIYLYLIWQVVNMTWNVFIACFYLDIGPYTINNSGDFNLVNLGTGSRSWFEANGPWCNAIYNVSDLTNHIQLIKPVEVSGCYLSYQLIECVQAGLQLIFSLNAFLISFFLIYSFSRKSFDANDDYIHQRNINHNNNVDNSLPPYTICNTIAARSSVAQRSIRSVHSDTMRKNGNNTTRMSTRSTKSHRAARRKQMLANHHAHNYNQSSNSNGNAYGTVNIAQPNKNQTNHNLNNNNYNTYKSIRSYNGQYNGKKYNSTTQLQPDNSSLDSYNMYGAQTNAGYYESRHSLYNKNEANNLPPPPLIQDSTQPIASTSQANTDTFSYHAKNINTMNSSVNNAYNSNTSNSNYGNSVNVNLYQSNNQNNSNNINYGSNHNQVNINGYNAQKYVQNNHFSSVNNGHDSIYNVYSSNPYNTYGKSATRQQQRPSSFCSNTSSTNGSSFLDNNMISSNPAGASSNHGYHGIGSRTSPIYMNSETRI